VAKASCFEKVAQASLLENNSVIPQGFLTVGQVVQIGYPQAEGINVTHKKAPKAKKKTKQMDLGFEE